MGDVLTTSDGKELAIEKIDVKKEHKTVYNFKVKDFHTYFVSNLGIWTHNSCGNGWIKHDTYNEIRNKFGKDGVDKFTDAMKKGFVSGQGENGIKLLSGDGVKV